jgi:hypothetical protein
LRYDPATNWMLNGDTSYDAIGNIVLLPNLQMNYDSQNRLVRMGSVARLRSTLSRVRLLFVSSANRGKPVRPRR